MRVLFIGITYHKSGVVTVYRHLIEGLKRYGIESRLIETFIQSTPYEAYGITVNKTEVERILNSPYLSNFKPDIIHVHTWACADPDIYTGGLQKILNYYGNPPVVFTFHRSDVSGHLDGEKQIIQIMELSSKIICISEGQKNDLKRRFPKYSDKYVVIHNVTDFDKYINDPLVEKKALKLRNALYGRKCMVYCGRLEIIKFVDKIVNAFNILAKKHDDLIFISIGTPKRAGLNTLVEFGLDRRLSNRVHTVFWIPAEWKRILGSHFRSLGFIDGALGGVNVAPHKVRNMYDLTVIESILMKSPTIANGDLATYSASPDVEEIVKGVEYILYSKKENEIKEKIENSFKISLEEYTLNGNYFIPRHIEVYKEAILENKKNKENNTISSNFVDKKILEKALSIACERKSQGIIDKSVLERALKRAKRQYKKLN